MRSTTRFMSWTSIYVRKTIYRKPHGLHVYINRKNIKCVFIFVLLRIAPWLALMIVTKRELEVLYRTCGANLWTMLIISSKTANTRRLGRPDLLWGLRVEASVSGLSSEVSVKKSRCLRRQFYHRRCPKHRAFVFSKQLALQIEPTAGVAGIALSNVTNRTEAER
jgi:hypothetical protein